MANSDDYDMIADGLSYMLDYSMFRDLTNLDYIDLTMPCWDQNANAGLSIANKHFVVTGDLLIHDKRGTWSQLFNKTLSANLQLENHYDLVREGKWTIDKYHENASLASNDTNGNGKMDEADTWGYLGEYYNFGIMMIGAGTHFTTKDEKDYPVLDMYSEHTVAAFEKVYAMLVDKNICLSMDWAQGGASATLTAFSEDRGLYYMTSIATASEYRYMDSDFGIIPIPKYDEAQENYYTSFSAGNSGAVAMPITVGDPDDKAFIMQAMCLASTDTLQVAFYDVVLTGVTARDEESGEMLDILFANRVYDLGFVQNWGGMRDLYSSLVKSGKKELASAYKRKEKTIIKAIDEAYETYQALE